MSAFSPENFVLAAFAAFELANRAHRQQVRKVNGTPYIAHPLAVAFAVTSAGARLPVVQAAALHDTLEDTDLLPGQIEAAFGPEVLALVQAVTEDKALTSWRQRKEQYLAAVAGHGTEVRLLSLADKLHNLSSIRDDRVELGEAVWTRFKVGREEQEWFYRSLLALAAADPVLAAGGLVAEYRKLVDEVFGRT